MNPQPLPGTTIAIVAAIGIVINTVTALLFFREKNNDLNIRSAYLHLLSDAIVSLGIVIGGIAIYYTSYYWIDPVLGILIAVVILFSTWNLLKSSLRLSLDAVPENISIDAIKSKISAVKGIKNIHHLHIWAMSTTENALTAHIVMDNNITIDSAEKIKHNIKHILEHENIHHATLETEPGEMNCVEKDC